MSSTQVVNETHLLPLTAIKAANGLKTQQMHPISRSKEWQSQRMEERNLLGRTHPYWDKTHLKTSSA